jgi:hypothetical protein
MLDGMAWRVALLIGVIIAVLLGGAAVYVEQSPAQTCSTSQTVIPPCTKSTESGGINWSCVANPTGKTVVRHRSCAENFGAAHRHGRYLGFSALAVFAITLASIPLLRHPTGWTGQVSRLKRSASHQRPGRVPCRPTMGQTRQDTRGAPCEGGASR